MAEEFDHEYHNGESFFYTKNEIGSNKEDHSLTRKIAQQNNDLIISTKTEQRQEQCWCFGCTSKASIWVREIQFDMRGDKAGINQHVVSTRDYNGPIPGFCHSHLGSGPTELAEKVYWDRTEIYLGLRPRKWWVIFTDGTKQGGLCEVLNPKELKPSTLDLHIKSSAN
jgi:hypothetical protein